MTGLPSVRGTAGACARPDRLRCFADQRSDRVIELFEMPQAVAMHRHPLRGDERGAGFRVGDFAQQLDAELEIMTLDVTRREYPNTGIRDLGGLDAFIYIGQTTTEVAEHGDFRETVVGESAREFVPVRRCHDSTLRYGETPGWMQWSPSRSRFPYRTGLAEQSTCGGGPAAGGLSASCVELSLNGSIDRGPGDIEELGKYCVRGVLHDVLESVGQVPITTVFGEYLDEAREERLAGVHGPELTVDVIPPPIETALVGCMIPVAPCPGFGTEPYPPDRSWVDAEDEAYFRHADD